MLVRGSRGIEGLFDLTPTDTVELSISFQHLLVVVDDDKLHHWVLDSHHSQQLDEDSRYIGERIQRNWKSSENLLVLRMR